MSTKPQTVLVVEDEASIASFVSAYLKNAGYGVRTAATGGDALRQVAARLAKAIGIARWKSSRRNTEDDLIMLLDPGPLPAVEMKSPSEMRAELIDPAQAEASCPSRSG